MNNEANPFARIRFQILSSDDDLGDRGKHALDLTVAVFCGEDEPLVVKLSTAFTRWESGAELSSVRGSGFTPSGDMEACQGRIAGDPSSDAHHPFHHRIARNEIERPDAVNVDDSGRFVVTVCRCFGPHISWTGRVSLLEFTHGGIADGDVPSTHDVVNDCRHAGLS